MNVANVRVLLSFSWLIIVMWEYSLGTSKIWLFRKQKPRYSCESPSLLNLWSFKFYKTSTHPTKWMCGPDKSQISSEYPQSHILLKPELVSLHTQSPIKQPVYLRTQGPLTWCRWVWELQGAPSDRLFLLTLSWLPSSTELLNLCMC